MPNLQKNYKKKWDEEHNFNLFAIDSKHATA